MSTALTSWPPPTTPRAAPGDAFVERASPPRAPVERRHRIVARVVALGLIGGSFMVDRSGLVLLPVLFVLVVPFEKMFPRHRDQRIRRPGLGVDITHALAAPLLGVAGVAVAIVIGVLSFAWLPGLLLRPLVALIPAAIVPFVGIALFDLASYWVHRWSHEVPLLWRFHSVHHSTEHLDWVSGFRNHPFDGALVAAPFLFLVAAGFDPAFTGVLAIVQVLSGLFVHANVRWRWAALHRVVITPEFHHWHHSNERDADNSNYSIFLPLWDTVFGTYFMPPHRRPQVYGIDAPMPLTVLGQLRHPFVGAGRPTTLLRRVVHHPATTVCIVGRGTRRLAAEVWRSTTRSTRP